MQRLLEAFSAIAAHRGQRLGRLGAALQEALGNRGAAAEERQDVEKAEREHQKSRKRKATSAQPAAVGEAYIKKRVGKPVSSEAALDSDTAVSHVKEHVGKAKIQENEPHDAGSASAVSTEHQGAAPARQAAESEHGTQGAADRRRLREREAMRVKIFGSSDQGR